LSVKGGVISVKLFAGWLAAALQYQNQKIKFLSLISFGLFLTATNFIRVAVQAVFYFSLKMRC